MFAIRRMIAWSAMPIAYILAGPLADNVFKPLLVEGGPLAVTVDPASTLPVNQRNYGVNVLQSRLQFDF